MLKDQKVHHKEPLKNRNVVVILSRRQRNTSGQEQKNLRRIEGLLTQPLYLLYMKRRMRREDIIDE
jgi:hypothetical protein